MDVPKATLTLGLSFHVEDLKFLLISSSKSFDFTNNSVILLDDKVSIAVITMLSESGNIKRNMHAMQLSSSSNFPPLVLSN